MTDTLDPVATTPCAFAGCQSGAILAGAPRVSRSCIPRAYSGSKLVTTSEYHPGCWAVTRLGGAGLTKASA